MGRVRMTNANSGTVSVIDTDPNSPNFHTPVDTVPVGAFPSHIVIAGPPVVDTDGDGIPDDSDNCPVAANAGQLDGDGDGVGNVCDSNLNDGPTGDLDGDGVSNTADVCANTPPGSQVDANGCAVVLQGTITTVAGPQNLSSPEGVVVGSDGSFFITDKSNHRIRRVDPKGVITTVAGNGTRGFSGDGGLAINAQLNFPVGAGVGCDGSLYIADTDNQRIRKVDLQGLITTVAGSGPTGGGPTVFSGDGGLATSARLGDPRGVAVGCDGSIYIADTHNHRIRKVDTNGVIDTVAGSGSVVGGKGWGPDTICGDGGPATSACLNLPWSVELANGNLYIADTDNQSIRKVDTAGIITTVAGTGPTGGDREASAVMAERQRARA